MKNKLVKNILGLLTFIFVLTGCSQNEDAISTLESTKQNILSFKTTDEFNETVSKVNAMSKTERLAWEKEQGIKSFGTICDEFYKTIDPRSFKNVDEVNAFVAKNNDKIKFTTSNSGNVYCEPQEFNNTNKYLINHFKMVIIGSKVYKYIDNNLISSDIVNIEKMKLLNSTIEISKNSQYEIIDNSSSQMKISSAIENTAYKENTIKIGSDNYLIKLYLRTNSYYDNADPRNQYPNPSVYYAYRRTEYRLINYSRWMFVWWITLYNSSIEGTLTTNDSYNVQRNITIIPIHGGCDDSGYMPLCLDAFTFIDVNINSTSYFVNYNVTATNLNKNLVVNLLK